MIMQILKLILFTISLLILAGCATFSRPALNFQEGAVVNTLTTAVSLSVHSPERSMSGNGFMVYRRPDKLHMILLSPFGTTLFEVFALGDQITLVYPSQGVAYSGPLHTLPKNSGNQGWRLMRWVMEADPVGVAKPDGTYKRTTATGDSEDITVDRGLITAKSNQNGEQVYYGGYALINKVPVASEIDIRNKADERIFIKLQETEVNLDLEETAFMPRLEGLKLLPLSAIETL